MIGSTGLSVCSPSNDYSRSVLDKNSGGPRRYPLTRETVPTAFVTPRTVQVSVQPDYKRGSITGTNNLHIGENRGTGVVVRPQPYSTPISLSMLDSPSTSGYESMRSTTSKLTSNDSLDDYQVRWSSSNLSVVSDPWTAENGGLGVATSSDRLDTLEQRLQRLESRLTSTSDRNRRELSCSCSSLVTPFRGGLHQFRPSQQQLACSTCLGGSAWTMAGTGGARNGQRIASLSDKVKQLQTQLDGERVIRSNLVKQNSKELVWKVDENETLKSRVKELEAENLMWKERARSQPDHSNREVKRLREMVQVLQRQLVAGLQQSTPELAPKSEPAPDQYVPIHKYRLLKAKSKKLLTDKCEALRNESLAKESLRVQLMLQNKELSELRRLVYETKTSFGNDQEIKVELLKVLDSCAFASSCLLGVCRDVAAKKRPDYDQILGLKSFDGCHPPTPTQSEMAVTPKDDPGAFQERLLAKTRIILDRLTRVQRLLVDYYSDQLVDSIDCRLQ